jgi:UDP-N-acetylmuramoyl-tripeptide--D-alanyl-D-alanine ligase
MMSLRQAAIGLRNATVRGNADKVFTRVHTDSRSVQAGDLFVALKGDRFDAHDFLPQVQANGAAAALIAPHCTPPEGLACLVVPDTKRALGELAAGWRAHFNLTLAVVTGSNGKTTTKDMIASIFRVAAGDGNYLSTQGNFNNDIGLPLTLLRLQATHRSAVIELGMNHPGETAELAAIAQPTIALVNNAQREHQEFMATVRAVAEEHAAAIRALPENGVAVFPGDDAYADVWRAAAGTRKRFEFGTYSDIATAPSSGAIAISMRLSRQNGLEIRMNRAGAPFWYAVSLQIHGAHNHHNALAAASVALAAGVAPEDIVRGLNAFAPARGRMQTVHGLAFSLIDDSYNANPDSVRAAIDALKAFAGSKVLVLGDMGDVGDQGPAFHEEVGRHAAAAAIDVLITVGNASAATHAAYRDAMPLGVAKHVASVDEAARVVRSLSLQAGDCVLVKGSRFMAMERVINTLKQQQEGAAAC